MAVEMMDEEVPIMDLPRLDRRTPCLDWMRKETARRRATGLCVVCARPVSAPRFENCDDCRRLAVEMYTEVLADPAAARRIPWAGAAIAEAIHGTGDDPGEGCG